MSTHSKPDSQESVTRREAMRRGALGAAGVIAATNLHSPVLADDAQKTPEQIAAEQKAARDAAAVAKAKDKGKVKSVIQIFLWGGMSHNDAWDPKPGTGYDYLGQFDKSIPTNVKEIQLSSLFPKLAQQADKYSLIRSMTHGNNGHETAAYLMQTGHKPGGRLAYPSIGAVFTYFKKDEYQGLLPPYIVMLRAAGRFSEEGFLGPGYKPFATGGDPSADRFEVQGIVNRGINDARQAARRELVDKVNLMGYGLADVPEMEAAEEARQKAYGLILGRGKEVFDLSNEPTELRDRYGRNTFGQECLAAPDGRGGCALRYDQLPRRLGYACQPLRHHAAAVSLAGPGAGHAAGGPERSRAVGQYFGLVHGRVWTHTQSGVGAAVEWRSAPLRLGLHGAGGRWRFQRWSGGRRFGREW